jgi:hypothetical protein
MASPSRWSAGLEPGGSNAATVVRRPSTCQPSGTGHCSTGSPSPTTSAVHTALNRRTPLAAQLAGSKVLVARRGWKAVRVSLLQSTLHVDEVLTVYIVWHAVRAVGRSGWCRGNSAQENELR